MVVMMEEVSEWDVYGYLCQLDNVSMPDISKATTFYLRHHVQMEIKERASLQTFSGLTRPIHVTILENSK